MGWGLVWFCWWVGCDVLLVVVGDMWWVVVGFAYLFGSSLGVANNSYAEGVILKCLVASALFPCGGGAWR